MTSQLPSRPWVDQACQGPLRQHKWGGDLCPCANPPAHYLGTEVGRYKGTKVQRHKGTKVQRHLPFRHVLEGARAFGAELA